MEPLIEHGNLDNMYIDPETNTTSIVLYASSRAGKSSIMMNIYNKYFKTYVETCSLDGIGIDSLLNEIVSMGKKLLSVSD